LDAGRLSFPKMLDTCFSSARRHDELACDRVVRAALGHQGEHLALAGREAAQPARLAGLVGARAHELGDDRAVQRGATAGDALDRLDERPHLPHALLEQVADAARARRQQLRRVDRFDVLRQDQDAQARMARAPRSPPARRRR